MSRKGEDARPGPLVRGAAVSGSGFDDLQEVFKNKRAVCPLARAGLTPEDIYRKNEIGAWVWSGGRFGQVIGERLTDHQRNCGRWDDFNGSEQDGASALQAQPGTGTARETLDQPGFAMHEQGEVTARCHADA